MLLVELDGRSPSFNLALEDALLSERLAQSGWFLLWQNDPSIIIGRHQVAEDEANLELARDLDIPYFRRVSGGGAVYHDRGVLNYSFIERPSIFPGFRHWLEPVRRSLRRLGVDAEIGGRNDLEVNGIKIGGAAIARRGDAILCHGSLLFDADLDRLAALLSPSKIKLKKRGIASVSSRVDNIKNICPDLDIGDLKKALASECSDSIGALPRSAITKAKILESAKYLTEAWNREKRVERRETRDASFAWGEVEWSWNWKNGKIADSVFRGDFFADREISELEKSLNGLSREDLVAFSGSSVPCRFFHGASPDEAATFFREEAAK
ncbi:MAG: lipoate--protein ligase [Desulfovibrio sp.]|nr:lipoate--protein ligase [Desulfovibrio sp.]